MNNTRSSNFCDGEASQKRAIRGRSCEGRYPRRGLTWAYNVTTSTLSYIHVRPLRGHYTAVNSTPSRSRVRPSASVLTCSTTWRYSQCVPFRDMNKPKALCFQIDRSSQIFTGGSALCGLRAVRGKSLTRPQPAKGKGSRPLALAKSVLLVLISEKNSLLYN